jgi:large subunit ribosomal protein L13
MDKGKKSLKSKQQEKILQTSSDKNEKLSQKASLSNEQKENRKNKVSKEKKASSRKRRKGSRKIKEIVRKEHQIDLAGLVFGRAAVQVALLLSGKRKVEYLPYLDQGDKVIAFNLKKLKFKGGRKMENKIYYHYSGYPGGIKKTPLKEAIEKDFPKVFRRAVYQMLPKNKLRQEMIKRLRIFKGEIAKKN